MKMEQNGLKQEISTQPPNDVVVVVVPFLTQSHLNQLLNLSHQLTTYNIPVHYAGTTTLIHQTKQRHHSSATTTNNNPIHYHDFQIPPKTKQHSSFLEYLIPTLQIMRQHVSQLLEELAPKFRRLILIHDTLMTSAVQDVRTIPHASSYSFFAFPCFFFFFHYWETTPIEEKFFELEPEIEEVAKCVPYCDWCPSQEFTEFAHKMDELSEEFDSGKIYNTSRLIEGKYIELLDRLSPPRIRTWALGPMNPMEVTIRSSQLKCLEWLDKQEKDTVIYVSFGTTTFMSDEQVRELAIGLERSGQNFLFALRRPDLDDGSNQLPEGFEERENKKGIVWQDWAPQLEILAHPATGGFMTHCGWGSCIESISMGVPIVAWPNQSDQPKNAILMSKVLEMGIIVRDWSTRDELVTADTVADVVRRLMETEEGSEMRKKAMDLRNALMESMHSGASELDTFVADITA